MKTVCELIQDTQTLVGASMHEGRIKIPVYDDGFGQLYIHRDSMGIGGIVRAQSWEDAYSICEDEFFPAPSETWEEMREEYSTQYLSGRELWLYEHDNNWEAWRALSEGDKNRATHPSNGKNVPFNGDITEHPRWQEAYGFRNNGRKEADGSISSIYAKDLNGDSLEVLTPSLLSDLGITLKIETNE